MEQLLMSGFLTFHLYVAACLHIVSQYVSSPCFFSYCCMNPDLVVLLFLFLILFLLNKNPLPSSPCHFLCYPSFFFLLTISLPPILTVYFPLFLSHSKLLNVDQARSWPCISCVKMKMIVLDISLNTQKNTYLFT